MFVAARLWSKAPGCVRAVQNALTPPWDAVAVSVESVASVESVIQQFVATSRAAVELGAKLCSSRLRGIRFVRRIRNPKKPRGVPSGAPPIAVEETDSTDVTESTENPDSGMGGPPAADPAIRMTLALARSDELERAARLDPPGESFRSNTTPLATRLPKLDARVGADRRHDARLSARTGVNDHPVSRHRANPVRTPRRGRRRRRLPQRRFRRPTHLRPRCRRRQARHTLRNHHPRRDSNRCARNWIHRLRSWRARSRLRDRNPRRRNAAIRRRPHDPRGGRISVQGRRRQCRLRHDGSSTRHRLRDRLRRTRPCISRIERAILHDPHCREQHRHRGSSSTPNSRSDRGTLRLGPAPSASAQTLRVVRRATGAVRERRQSAEAIAQLEQVTTGRALRRGDHRLGATDVTPNSAHWAPPCKSDRFTTTHRVQTVGAHELSLFDTPLPEGDGVRRRPGGPGITSESCGSARGSGSTTASPDLPHNARRLQNASPQARLAIRSSHAATSAEDVRSQTSV